MESKEESKGYSERANESNQMEDTPCQRKNENSKLAYKS